MGLRGRKPEILSKTLAIPGLSDKRARPPSGMSREARRAWKSITASLPSSHFRPGDYPLLHSYCEAYAKTLRMQMTIEVEGDFLPGARNGSKVAHPAHAVKLATETLMANLATKLRLCANSRLSNSKASFEKPDEPAKGKRKGLMFGEV